MILINGVPGRLVPRTAAFGATPADFPALGDYPSPLSNDLPSLTDRADAEWLWCLLTPLMGTGNTETDDDGGYAVISPATGNWTQTYRSLVMPPTGAPQVEDSTISLSVSGLATTALVGAAARMAAGVIVAVGTATSGVSTGVTGVRATTAAGIMTATGSSLGAAEATITGAAISSSAGIISTAEQVWSPVGRASGTWIVL